MGTEEDRDRGRDAMSWNGFIWVMVAIALLAFVVGLLGCAGPGANFATYGSSLNGQFGYPAGAPAFYEPAPFYAYPTRTTCMPLPGGGGGWVSCRNI